MHKDPNKLDLQKCYLCYVCAQRLRRPQALLCQQTYHRDNLPSLFSQKHHQITYWADVRSKQASVKACRNILAYTEIILFVPCVWYSNIDANSTYVHQLSVRIKSDHRGWPYVHGGNSEHHMAGIKAFHCAVSPDHLAPLLQELLHALWCSVCPFCPCSHLPAACLSALLIILF